MRVLVDLLFFTGTKGGMESYVRETYARLSPDDPEFEFVGLASRELAEAGAPWFPGPLVDSGVRGDHRPAWAIAEIASVSRHAVRHAADLVHCPANFGPWRSRVPVVLTVHDLLAFRHPEYVPGAHARVVRSMIRRAASAATRIVTVSDATRLDVVSLLGVTADRVDVIPLAASPSPPAHEAARSRDRVLAVGNRMPHKGFETLLEAMACIRRDRRPHLVITGGPPDDPLAPVVERLGLEDCVELRGWLEPAELDRLYRTSAALVFPTRFEGFGLPPLEAMARGCPVVVSDLPVMHEVAGDAAVYVDPTSPAAIARAVEALLDDPGELERRSRAGLRRAAEFSWERTAEATRAAFRAASAAAGEPGSRRATAR